jgi:hypothetical protein
VSGHLVTIPLAARATKIPERDIRRAIEAGDLRALRWSERKTYVDLADVVAWAVASDSTCR